MQSDSLLARSLLLPVPAHPGLKGLTGRGVAPGEGQRGDLGVRDGQLGTLIRRNDPDGRIGERGSGTAVEYISVDRPAVFEGKRNVASVVEGLLKGGVDL